MWDLHGRSLATLQGHQSIVRSASFSPDGQHIVTASSDKTARVWDLHGRSLATLQGHQSAVTSASFSPDGQHIVTASSDKTARVWRVESLDQLLKHACQWLNSYYLAFSPNVYKNNAFDDDVNKESISQDLKLCTENAELK